MLNERVKIRLKQRGYKSMAQILVDLNMKRGEAVDFLNRDRKCFDQVDRVLLALDLTYEEFTKLNE